MVTQERVNLVPTGNTEIDQKLGGGIPLGSLLLLEGEADAGKSVFAQHFTHAALRSRLSVAHYSTESTIKDLMSQMTSLDLDVTDYFLCDRLRAYPIRSSDDADRGEALNSLLEHFRSLPIDIRLIIVDALTDLIAPGDERQTVDFFATCKQLCDLGRTIILVMRCGANSDAMQERVLTICDTHLVLRIEEQDERPVRVMEVAKLNKAAPAEENVIYFNVEPGFGLKVVSPTAARR
jgi:flagellar protein FlaH